MAKTKVKIQLEAETAKAAKNIADLEKHLQSMQIQFKNIQIGSQDFRDFGKEIEIVRGKLDMTSKSAEGSGQKLMGLAMQIGAVGVSAAAMIDHYKAVIQKSREFEQANMKLEAAAKLTGVALSQLRATSESAQQQYGLNVKQANEFTISLSKLTAKAGESGKITQTFAAFLDLAAAQGLNAEQALEALNQTLMGQDEGLDKLVQKNPSAIYEEFAKQIGVSAGKMNDQQKAQAIMNEFLAQGAKVQGQYAANLNTTAGRQQAFNNAMDTFAAKVGKEADKVLGGILNLLLPVANAISKMESSTLASVTALGLFAASIYTAGQALIAFGVIANTTPIGWIATAVGAVAGAFTFLYAEMTKATPEMEKAQQLAGMTGDAFKKQYDELKKTNPEVALLAKATRDLANAEERLKQIRDGKIVGSESQATADIENAKVRIAQNEVQLRQLDEQRKLINDLQKKVDKAQDIVNKNRNAQAAGKVVVGKENAENLLAKLSQQLVQERANLAVMLGRNNDIDEEMLTINGKLASGISEVDSKVNALNKKADRIIANPNPRPPAGAAPPPPKSPPLPPQGSSIVGAPGDQSRFDAIVAENNYQNYQRGMMNRIQTAGAERNLGDLQMYALMNKGRMESARLNGDEREFKDALNAMERAHELAEEVKNTLSDGAQRYANILGLSLSQVADAFGDQVAASLFRDSFSIGQMFENIAKQFVSQIVSELIKQQVSSLFTSLFPGGGFLKLLGFADGGRPPMGRVSVVGERGAEVFKPDVPGRVIPNNEVGSQIASMLELFSQSRPPADLAEVSLLLSAQRDETVKLRKALNAKDFAVDIDGERANSRLKRVERRIETRIY